MSEARLWARIREAVWNYGHFDRREFNPVDGVPDVNFCINGIEGHLELKFRRDPPIRDTTPVFPRPNKGGLRESQAAWIARRMSAGGRVFILPQIGTRLYLLHGYHAVRFKDYAVEDFEQVARWSAGPIIKATEWFSLTVALTDPFKQRSR